MHQAKDLVSFKLSSEGASLALSPISVAVLVVIVVGVLWLSDLRQRKWMKTFEVDEAELGIGNQRIKLRPNRNSVQVAYRLWVELSTRKVGLKIDLEHDIIVDIYDSWYAFFKVTRDLLKEIPSHRLSTDPATTKVVQVAIQVLNESMRPHLTDWQGRYRRWHSREAASEACLEMDPQLIQTRYPRYAQLSADLLRVNEHLIAYRNVVTHLVFGSGFVSAVDRADTATPASLAR